MNDTTAAKLIALNQEFYQTFAVQFSATRQRIQPGVQRILETINPGDSILDLGCGNGELARLLAQRGHRGRYVGLDFSEGLLAVARTGVTEHPNFHFVQANLAEPGWKSQIVSSEPTSNPSTDSGQALQPFDLILAFATFHHLPGKKIRLQILQAVCSLMAPDGFLIHSNWQFLNSDRLRARLQDWNDIGLSKAEVDPGDYLLDWRLGGTGFRYVHHFSEAELALLAEETGFKTIENFYSDGETGNLGLYQIWQMNC